MHLFELCDSMPSSSESRRASVPAWVLGCFRRRSITFFTGAEDAVTEVIWLQSRGLTADFRRTPRAEPPGSPSPRHAHTARRWEALAALPVSELVALALVEGGLARTRWDGELMHWSDWTAFQTHAKWPEAGRLTRVGGCMVELAPSGAYVEDWRYEPSPGPLIGLELIDERDASDGSILHRGGGLVICGEHAGFVRGRPEPLAAFERLEDFVRTRAHDATALARAFACDAAYGTARARPDEFTVRLATLPWREGTPLLSLEGFELLPDGVVSQHVEEGGRRLERRFIVDTLERAFDAEVATTATDATTDWFAREVAPMLATVR